MRLKGTISVPTLAIDFYALANFIFGAHSPLAWSILFLTVVRVFSASTAAAEAKALDEADDGHAQEEGHQAADLANKLDSIFWEIVDVLILE